MADPFVPLSNTLLFLKELIWPPAWADKPVPLSKTVTLLKLIMALAPPTPLERIPVVLLADVELSMLIIDRAAPTPSAATPASSLFSVLTLSRVPETVAEAEGLKRIPPIELFRTVVWLMNT